MSNSSSVATVFVNFKSAFDQLWFAGCFGKLLRMGISKADIKWIGVWLYNRRAVVEIAGKRSRWFPIKRGGPQGSCFTPILFITYHSDMEKFLCMAMSFFFADDLAAVIAARTGIRFTEQCIDLERRLNHFFALLEFYAILSVQPINYIKTQAMFSARAVSYPNPMPRISCGGYAIEWVKTYKYLGYWVATKIGWGNMVNRFRIRIRQQVSMINSIRFTGTTSPSLRRILFSTFVLPFFTWLFVLFPLFTHAQITDLSHYYYTSLKRIYHCLHWNDLFFSFAYNEKSLEDHVFNYWTKYLKNMANPNSIDGMLLQEQCWLNNIRAQWQQGNLPIKCLRRSKRFVPHIDVLTRSIQWLEEYEGAGDSIFELNSEELELFSEFSETF
ncbi:unnamed protein product [Rotaria magnacalcarata]|uniref:Reverse transcriptase domain-containing protein n=2 Tax=Rotaria magnacalcarata TaxID=392030 RepID=A0A816LSL5_9BILA|nr:unnamed protein product [Rotaria magnacalcarata]